MAVISGTQRFYAVRESLLRSENETFSAGLHEWNCTPLGWLQYPIPLTGDSHMKTIIRIALASLILLGTFNTVALADGSTPRCLPGHPCLR